MRSGLPVKPQAARKPLCRIAHVVLLDEIGVVAEHGDRRRRGLDLRRVVQLDLAAGRLRRLPAREQLAELRRSLSDVVMRLSRSASTCENELEHAS